MLLCQSLAAEPRNGSTKSRGMPSWPVKCGPVRSAPSVTLVVIAIVAVLPILTALSFALASTLRCHGRGLRNLRTVRNMTVLPSHESKPSFILWNWTQRVESHCANGTLGPVRLRPVLITQIDSSKRLTLNGLSRHQHARSFPGTHRRAPRMDETEGSVGGGQLDCKDGHNGWSRKSPTDQPQLEFPVTGATC